MKKILSFILAMVLVLGLCACGASGSKTGSSFSVGYGREQIMPSGNKIGMAGYGNAETRVSNSFLDYLYATCIAIRDEADTTILQFHLDLISTNETTFNQVVEAVSTATGLPAENIFLSATHTHSAPATSYDVPGMDAYRILLAEQCAKAAQAAIADLSPAEMSAGRVTLEGMNFVRHYIQESGEYVGSNFGDWTASPLKAHAGNGDPEMQILKFTRSAEGKKDILMMNWAAHPCFTDESGNGTNLSADFIGTCRSYVEAQTGCDFIYFTGAAGNQNANSKIESEAHKLNNKTYGEKLGQTMIDQLENLTPVASGLIQTKRAIYESPINKEDCERVADAMEVVTVWETADKTAGTKKAKELGFGSVYHANSVINRSKMEGVTPIEITTVSFGGFSWVNAPYEMFAQSSLDIKEQTPFDMTFIITCSGKHNGYIPTQEAYDYGCYESQTSKLSPGTAEALVENYVSMLNEMHTASTPTAE